MGLLVEAQRSIPGRRERRDPVLEPRPLLAGQWGDPSLLLLPLPVVDRVTLVSVVAGTTRAIPKVVLLATYYL